MFGAKVFMFGARASEATKWRPRPRLVKAMEPSKMSEYESLAREIDFYPGQLLQERIKSFLAEHGIETFDNNEVHRYMEKEATSASLPGVKNGRSGEADRKKSLRHRVYSWRPLRAIDGHATWRWPSYYDANPYDKAVPVHILRQVKLINDHFNGQSSVVKFFVTDYAVPNPDPFIAVRGAGTELIVFGVWDEPEFFSK